MNLDQFVENLKEKYKNDELSEKDCAHLVQMAWESLSSSQQFQYLQDYLCYLSDEDDRKDQFTALPIEEQYEKIINDYTQSLWDNIDSTFLECCTKQDLIDYLFYP